MWVASHGRLARTSRYSPALIFGMAIGTYLMLNRRPSHAGPGGVFPARWSEHNLVSCEWVDGSGPAGLRSTGSVPASAARALGPAFEPGVSKIFDFNGRSRCSVPSSMCRQFQALACRWRRSAFPIVAADPAVSIHGCFLAPFGAAGFESVSSRSCHQRDGTTNC